MDVTARLDSGRTWLGTALGAVVVFAVGSLAFPQRVYDGFIWHYFWGPIYADAHNAACAVADGTPKLLYQQSQCRIADASGAIVAEPGYTVVSEIGYMIILLFMLVGVLQLLRYLDVTRERRLFYALLPFMLFGGALRVVEDAFDAVPRGVEPAITYPLNTLIISPLIYFTVFVLTLGSLLVSYRLYSDGVVDRYPRVMGLIGAGLFTVTFGYLVYLALTVGYVDFHPQVLLSVVVLASLLSGVIYVAAERLVPAVNEGTGLIGLAVLWGHAIDGVANVIAADWLGALGVDLTYSAKHPANRFIIDVSSAILPQSVISVLGTSWPFLVVKLVVAFGVVWIFDAKIFEENRRYALLLLTAIVAVGLGPGTRDMIRATFGI